MCKVTNYEETRVKLTNTRLKKLKSAAKTETKTTLRITKKKLQDEEFPNDLFLTRRQKNVIRNAFLIKCQWI